MGEVTLDENTSLIVRYRRCCREGKARAGPVEGGVEGVDARAVHGSCDLTPDQPARRGDADPKQGASRAVRNVFYAQRRYIAFLPTLRRARGAIAAEAGNSRRSTG